LGFVHGHAMFLDAYTESLATIRNKNMVATRVDHWQVFERGVIGQIGPDGGRSVYTIPV
jgi:hypothetical protein